jgi:crotonobetainyl-CoA:carnitine CoA-transferase CaiB-like acyl-CoA transferase
MRERTASEWRALFDASGVPNGVVRSVLEVLEAAHGSAITGMAPSVPGSIRRRPPKLGEHTELVRLVKWRAFQRDAQ